MNVNKLKQIIKSIAIEKEISHLRYKDDYIFNDSILLFSYPIETIFAEKLQAIISLGAINSRMKDYHDVILILRNNDSLNMQVLKDSITNTFKTRKTDLVNSIQFDNDDIKEMQKLWANHLNKLKPNDRKSLKLPEHIKNVLEEINYWLSNNPVFLHSR